MKTNKLTLIAVVITVASLLVSCSTSKVGGCAQSRGMSGYASSR